MGWGWEGGVDGTVGGSCSMEMSCSSKLIPAQSSATSEMIGGVKRVIRESGDHRVKARPLTGEFFCYGKLCFKLGCNRLSRWRWWCFLGAFVTSGNDWDIWQLVA